MFMQHRVIKKGFGPNQITASIGNIFGSTGVQMVAQGDGWRLGSHGSALVLVQAMGISSQESFVMTVAAAPDANPAAIADAVNAKIKGLATL